MRSLPSTYVEAAMIGVLRVAPGVAGGRPATIVHVSGLTSSRRTIHDSVPRAAGFFRIEPEASVWARSPYRAQPPITVLDLNDQGCAPPDLPPSGASSATPIADAFLTHSARICAPGRP